MGFKKIENLLDIDTDDFTKPKYNTKKWIEIFDQSNGSYSVNKDIRFKTSQLRNLLYYSKNFRKATGSLWNYYPDFPVLNMLVIMEEQVCFIQLVLQIVLVN